MAYTRSADGVAQHGKTKGKNLGDTGPSIGIQKGPSKAGGVGKLNADMKKMGRGLAKVAAQKRG